MATLSDIEVSQAQQDRGIRKEFQNVHQALEEQRSHTDDRFKKQRSYMDGRFEQIDQRFSALETMVMNAKATTSWHDIAPLAVMDPLAKPETRYQMPPNFPAKVAKFWHLQRPRNQHILISLLRFYNIQGLERTQDALLDDSDDSDSELSPESPCDLEQAVKRQPTLALSRLAARLGLDYESISHNMGIVETLQEVRAQKMTREGKRENPSEREKKSGDDVRPTKRAARMITSDPEQQSSSPRAPAGSFKPITIGGVPITMFDDEEHHWQPSSPSRHSYVYWATHSLASGPKIRDLPERLPSQPQAAIKESATTLRSGEAADPPASCVSISPPDQKSSKPSDP